jgi:hypothetical protein
MYIYTPTKIKHHPIFLSIYFFTSEHVWDFIGRKINQRNPKCQNIDELRTAILQEWQQFPQEQLRRLL